MWKIEELICYIEERFKHSILLKTLTAITPAIRNPDELQKSRAEFCRRSYNNFYSREQWNTMHELFCI